MVKPSSDAYSKRSDRMSMFNPPFNFEIETAYGKGPIISYLQFLASSTSEMYNDFLAGVLY